MQLSPKATALVLIDLQKGVLAMPVAPHSGVDVYERSKLVAERFRAAGALVVRVRVSFGKDHALAPRQPVDQPTNLAGLPAGWDGFPDHPEENGDIVVTKRQWGAFHGTDLDLILRNRGIDTVIITGICTNVCCETTAREANMRDYKVFFISDATATFNTPEVSADQIQPVVLATLKAAFAQIENTTSMIRKLEEHRSAFAA